MSGSQKGLALALTAALGVLIAVAVYGGKSAAQPIRSEAVAGGDVSLAPMSAPEGSSNIAAPSVPAGLPIGVFGTGSAGMPRERAFFAGYTRGTGVAHSDLRIPLRKERAAAAALAPEDTVALAAATETYVDSGIVAAAPLPLIIPKAIPVGGGGFGGFPALFAALIGGVALEAALNSPDHPAGVDSTGTPTTPVVPVDSTKPPTTPPDTTTHPTTPPDTTTHPTTPTDTTTHPTTPTDTTTHPTTPTDTTTHPTPTDTTTVPVVPTDSTTVVPVTATPEPSTLVLLASGFAMLAVFSIRKRRLPRSK